MSRYASKTTVSSDKSRAEIERTLVRYGATAFMYGYDGSTAVIQFEIQGRRMRFLLPLPDRTDREFTHTEARGVLRDIDAAHKHWEQACRQRWRALALVIKAKLEAVQSGITTVEEEFMAHIVLPDGSTAGQFMLPQIAAAYHTGNMPKMLPMPDMKG